MKKQNKLDWINHAKFIGIVLVFLYHSAYFTLKENGLLYNLYYPFYTNIFYFISGYLIYRKHLTYKNSSDNIKLTIRNRGIYFYSLRNVLYRLIWPTFLFSILSFFLKVLFYGVNPSMTNILTATVFGGSYWFTSSLVVAEILMFILLSLKLDKLRWLLIISICLALVSKIISPFFLGHIPWFYKEGMLALLFLVFGCVYNKFEVCIDKLIKVPSLLYFVSLIMYISIMNLYENSIICTLIDCKINLYGIIISIIAVVLVLSACKIAPYNSITNKIGSQTLGLYFFCGIIPYGIGKIAIFILPSLPMVSFFITFMCSFILSVFIVSLLYKYYPCVYNFCVLIDKSKHEK